MQQRRSSRRRNEEVDEACIDDIASDHEMDVVDDSTDDSTDEESEVDSESEAYCTGTESDLSFSTDESSISESLSGTWTADENSLSSDSEWSGNWTEEESDALFSSDSEDDEV